jgi:hypothetical protein
MKYCSHCFRFAIGQPPYCTVCGRSYNVRRCKRGHVNSRFAQFCFDCGSEDLSQPAPPERFLSLMARWTVQLALGMFVALVALAAGVSLFAAIDWSAIAPRLVMLGLVVWFLYWTSTLLPGPIRKVGGKFGRHMLGNTKSKEGRQKHG